METHATYVYKFKRTFSSLLLLANIVFFINKYLIIFFTGTLEEDSRQGVESLHTKKYYFFKPIQ